MGEKKSRLMVFRVIGLLFMALSIYIVVYTLNSNQKKSFWSQFKNQPKFNLFKQASVWRNQLGKNVALDKFEKKISLVTFVYAKCRSACPRIMSDIIRLNNNLKKENIRIKNYIFLFDSNASQKVIDEFYNNYSISKKEYTVLTASKKSIHALAKKYRVKFSAVKKDGSKEFDYMHNNLYAIHKSDGDVLLVDYGLMIPQEKVIKAIRLSSNEK